jgi:hypothetical protein
MMKILYEYKPSVRNIFIDLAGIYTILKYVLLDVHFSSSEQAHRRMVGRRVSIEHKIVIVHMRTV